MLKKLISTLLLIIAPLSGNDNSRMTFMQDEIKYVVVVMMENRSFDNVLAWLYDKDDAPNFFIPESSASQPFLGLTDDTLHLYQNTLKNSAGEIVFSCNPIKGIPSTHATNYLNSPKFDPHEPYPYVINQIYGFEGSTTPDMSGFLQDYASQWQESTWKDNLSDICAVMETYTSAELPVFYALAKNYAVSDLWFSSVPTQTNPNRAFAACGTSEGEVVNGVLGTNAFYSDTLWNRLTEEAPTATWSIFWQADMIPGIIPGSYYKSIYKALGKITNINDHFQYIDSFHELARNGQLPDYSFIEPQWTVEVGIDEDLLVSAFKSKTLHVGIQGNDLHPPGDVRTAENFLANIYTSLTANTEAWNQTLLIITFDEHGGLYDHVPPPAAIPPDDRCQNGFKFDRYGVRIPTLLISPKINKGTIIRSDDPSIPFDHTSVIAMILKWKNVDKAKWNMGQRVENAPTFENVITRNDARTDTILMNEAENPPQGDNVKMGDLFYLKNKDGHYITGSKKVINDLASIGDAKDKTPFSFSCGSGAVTHGSFVIIQSGNPDYQFGKNLEILYTHCECIFNQPKKTPRQWWTVKSVDHPYVGYNICYGDKVYIENHIYLDPFQYIPARLVKRDTLFNNYLTTIPVTSKDSSQHYWTIEQATSLAR